ncbi:MAG: YggT family protein [Pacificimonas sp.]
MGFLFQLLGFISYLLTFVTYLIIAQVIFSWLISFNVINTSNDFVRSIYMGLERLFAPIYRPIRRFMPDLGGLDLSPMILLLLILFIQRVVIGGLMMELAGA